VFSLHQGSLKLILIDEPLILRWFYHSHQLIKLSLPRRLMRTTMMMRRRRMSPSTLHIHHHDSSTTMTSKRTKIFPVLRVDQIGKVWEVTLIVALINRKLTIMMILLLKSSLLSPLLWFL
jgi:hypothetical protein